MTACIQANGLADALRLQPVADLEIGDHAGAGALGNADRIADMIAMSM